MSTLLVGSAETDPQDSLGLAIAAVRGFERQASSAATAATAAKTQSQTILGQVQAAAETIADQVDDVAANAAAATTARAGIETIHDAVEAAKDDAEAARDQALTLRAQAETASTNGLAAAVIAVDAATSTATLASAAFVAKTIAETKAAEASASAASIDTDNFLDTAGTRPMTGPLTFDGPDANGASAVLPSGADPNSPVTGALWRVGTMVKVRINGLLSAVVAFTNVAQTWTEVQTFAATRGVVLTDGGDPVAPVTGQAWYNGGFFGWVGGVKRRIVDFSLKATTALAQAGTDDATFMTPASAADAIAYRAALPAASATLGTAATTTSTTYVDTGLSVTLTPRQGTGKVLVSAGLFLQGASTGNPVLRIVRGSTALFETQFFGTNLVTLAPDLIDSPVSAAPVTYKVQIAGTAGVAMSLLVNSTLTAVDIG